MSDLRTLFLLLALLVFSASCLPSTAQAQDPMWQVDLPDSIVVTASRMPDEVRLTGRRITVWTARDLEDLPVTSFDELLRTVGGVEVLSRGGFGIQSDITMRGSTFNGVLILLDGARFNDPMTGHFLTDVPVPLSDIARIEVLRGPATSLYGPDALGGVIQIFTYAGLQQARPEKTRTEGSAQLQGGDDAFFNFDAALRHAGRSTSFSFSTTWQGSDGQPISDESGRPITGTQGPLRTDFTRKAHTLALVQALGDLALLARIGLDDRDFGAFHFYTPFPSDTAREATRTLWAQLRLQQHTASPTRWEAQVAARQHDDTYVYNAQTLANEHTSRLFYGQGNLFHTLNPQLTLGGGVSASFRSIDSNNLGQHDDGAGGGFASARWQALERLTLNASGRLDYDPGFGWEPTPQLSAAYNSGILTLRAAVGRAVRAPNYIERYFNTTLPRPRGRSLGNPDLDAERAWSYEAGLDLYPLPGLVFNTTLFRRDTENLIDYVKVTPEDTVFLAYNLLSVQTTGLELDFELYRSLGGQRVRLTGSYTYLDANLGDTTQVTAYKYALTNARHLVQSNAAVDMGPLTLGVKALWREPLAGEAYGVVDFRLAYRLQLGARRLSFSGELRNIFDHRYSEVFDAPMPGRWWIVGIKLVR